MIFFHHFWELESMKNEGEWCIYLLGKLVGKLGEPNTLCAKKALFFGVWEAKSGFPPFPLFYLFFNF
jgi:hypothetical protein